MIETGNLCQGVQAKNSLMGGREHGGGDTMVTWFHSPRRLLLFTKGSRNYH